MLQKKIRKTSSEYNCDVTDKEQMNDTVQQIIKDPGSIDISE